MKREGRWENQKKLIQRITKITTRILPEDEGVALRFINRTVDNSSNLTIQEIAKIMDPMSWEPGGNTQIGTYLRSKILEPLVYDKISVKDLQRPLLISIMTDGIPDGESKSDLVSVILECGKKLQDAGYPRESVCLVLDSLFPVFLHSCHLLTVSTHRCEVHDWPDWDSNQGNKLSGHP